MATEPRLLLLDEPSSGLAQSEVEVLGPSIRRLSKDTGCGVVVIEHDMPLIQALSDRLIAMELGAVLVEGRPEDVVGDPRVREAYLGASKATIERSGSSLAEALVTAGILETEAAQGEDRRTNGRTKSRP
jgi:branched-chain amino acid transport system ATP-binding protein